MRKTRGLLLFVLACAMVQARGDWISAGKETDGTEYLVDVSNIQLKDGVRRTWVQTVAAPHTMKAPGDARWIKMAVSREAVNCGEKTFRVESLHTYFEDGTDTSTIAKNLPNDWRAVSPDSGQSTTLEFICAWNIRAQYDSGCVQMTRCAQDLKQERR